MGKGPLFLNTPIASSVHDVVGVEMYVEKLDMAIDAGAQMIALTSPFGAGKSSVIELLQKKRKDLDRMDASEVILQFLKELRKYYVPKGTAVSYLNRVTFLEQFSKILRKVQRSRNRMAALSSLTGVSPSASSALSCDPRPRFLFSHDFRELLWSISNRKRSWRVRRRSRSMPKFLTIFCRCAPSISITMTQS